MNKTAPRKMQEYRDRLRVRGLRPLQIWVPDTRDPRVRSRVRRQARFLFRQPSDPEIERFLDGNLADIDGWTA